MAVNPVSTPTAAPATGASASAAGFAQNFDSFLLLLTTQLKNQDPLSPLSSTEFTTQLVQFAGVEQSIRQNKNLEEIVAMQKAWEASNAVNYIGKTIDAAGQNVMLQNGAADIRYTLDDSASKTTITIRDVNGEIVRTLSGNTIKGTHTLTWDGQSNDNTSLPDGIYTISVAATRGNNISVGTSTGFSGVVSAVETVDGKVLLRVGSGRVPIGDVTSVRDVPAS